MRRQKKPKKRDRCHHPHHIGNETSRTSSIMGGNKHLLYPAQSEEILSGKRKNIPGHCRYHWGKFVRIRRKVHHGSPAPPEASLSSQLFYTPSRMIACMGNRSHCARSASDGYCRLVACCGGDSRKRTRSFTDGNLPNIGGTCMLLPIHALKLLTGYPSMIHNHPIISVRIALPHITWKHV